MEALNPNKTISPRDLSRAIGVSESSLKRWADQGILTVSRTAGGHRRIRVNEAIRFVRKRKLSIAVPSALGLSGRLADVDQQSFDPGNDQLLRGLGPEVAPFVRLLESGDGESAELLLLGKYLSGVSIAVIGDQMIRPALEHLGHGPHGAEEILKEHRATQVCLQSIAQMRAMSTWEQPVFRAVGGGSAGDSYMLPTLLAAAVIEESGGRAVNLGANTPIRALMVEAFPGGPSGHLADLIWLSVSEPITDSDEQSSFTQLVDSCRQQKVHLMIGGRSSSTLQGTLGSDPVISYHNTLESMHATVKALFTKSESRFSA